jgi:ABC-2 type transport system permease protein
MRTALTITALELRRFLRDRANIFFVFIMPLVLVMIVGAQFGGDGQSGQVAVVGPASSLRTAVVDQLTAADVTVTFTDRASALEQVARGRTDAALVVDEAASTAFDAGDDLTLEIVPSSQADSIATSQRVRTAIEAVRAEQAQHAALQGAGASEADAAQALEQARATVVPADLRIVDVDEIAQEFSGLGQFDLGASSQLLLFVFLSSLTGSASLIQSRRLGVTARTLASPVSTAEALGGQVLGRFAIAFTQGAYIMAGSALLFDVDWGNVWLSLLVLVVFSLVSAGAAMLIGSLMDNEGAASGLGVGAGLVLAALGGCMLPLDFFSDTLRTIAHVTPHAWATDAFAQIQRHDGTLGDILPQLGVLAAMALALLALGSWALRRSLSRAL